MRRALQIFALNIICLGLSDPAFATARLSPSFTGPACEILLIEDLLENSHPFSGLQSLPQQLLGREQATLLLRLPISGPMFAIAKLGLDDDFGVEIPLESLFLSERFIHAVLKGKSPALIKFATALEEKNPGTTFQILDAVTEDVPEVSSREMDLVRNLRDGYLGKMLEALNSASPKSVRADNGLEEVSLTVAAKFLPPERLARFQDNVRAIRLRGSDGAQMTSLAKQGLGRHAALTRFLQLWKSLARGLDPNVKARGLTGSSIQRTIAVLKAEAPGEGSQGSP